MGEIVGFENTNEGVNSTEIVSEQNDLVAVAEDMLASAREQIKDEKTISVPIDQLSALGTGISSLIPALNQVTQSTTIREKGLYRLANADVGDVLKKAKDGNFWGAYDLGLHDAYLILAAKDAGYDTLIMGIRDADAIRERLSIPENEEIMSVIAVGKAGEEPALRPRKKLDEVVRFF